LAIFFHDEQGRSGLKNKRIIRSWLKEVLIAEGAEEGEINIIFTSDENLRSINKTYLSKDYYTDIITFDYTDGVRKSGDLFISMERVAENGIKYACGTQVELRRVMVHGILHLLGYNDISESEKNEMREMEEKFLQMYNSDY